MSVHQIEAASFQIVYRTDIGRKRTNNEDFVGALAPSNLAQLKRDGALIVVADGVGGHEFGERASQYVVKTLLGEYYRMPNVPPEGRLTRIITQASQDIHARALEELGEGKRMATTVVAAILRDDTVQIAHVGDSRAYLIRNGKAHMLTRDHSFVAEKVRAGLMTPEEAERSKFRSRLTQSVGGSEEVTVDVTPPIPLVPGDQILLCSDGLTRYVSDEELGTICSPAASPQEIVDRLIHLANERGGADNITAALARYQPTTAKPRPAKTKKGLNALALRLGAMGLAILLAFAMGMLVRGWWGSGAASSSTPTPVPTHLALPTVLAMATAAPQGGAKATLATATPATAGAPSVSPLPQTQSTTWLINGAQGNVKTVASAAGKVAVLFEQGGVYLATAANGGKPTWQSLGAQGVTAMALSPDGNTLAEARQDGTVTFHNTAAPQQVMGTFKVKGKILTMAFSPDSRTVALGDSNGGVWQVRLAKGGKWQLQGEAAILQTGGQPVRGLALSSQWLAIALPDGVHVARWPDGKALTLAAKSPADALAVTFAPDGRWLVGAFADRVVLWKIQGEKWQHVERSQKLPGQPTGVVCPATAKCVLAVATPGGFLEKGEALWMSLPKLEWGAPQGLHTPPTGGMAVLDARRVLIGTSGGLVVVARP